MTDQPQAHVTGAPDASLSELLARMQEQTNRLIRDELRLAKSELTDKGKKAGLGVGLFGGAGVISLFGGGAFVAAAILALAIPLAGWLAALLVGVALLLVAGIAALAGKREVSQVGSPVPAETMRSVSEDIQAVKPGTAA